MGRFRHRSDLDHALDLARSNPASQILIDVFLDRARATPAVFDRSLERPVVKLGLTPVAGLRAGRRWRGLSAVKGTTGPRLCPASRNVPSPHHAVREVPNPSVVNHDDVLHFGLGLSSDMVPAFLLSWLPLATSSFSQIGGTSLLNQRITPFGVLAR